MSFLSIFWMVIKRVWNNWKLEVNLLFALIMAVAIISSVPIYTDGALQFVLEKRWIELTREKKVPQGALEFSYPSFYLEEEDFPVADFVAVNAYLDTEAARRIGLPLYRAQRYAVLDNYFSRPTAGGVKYGRLTYDQLPDMGAGSDDFGAGRALVKLRLSGGLRRGLENLNSS